MCAGFVHGGEAAVTHDLSPLLIALKREGNRLEEEMFITTQLFEEAKHVELFDCVFAQVIGESVDLSALAGSNYTALFNELSGALDTLLIDSSPAAQVKAVASYHMIVEGVVAETGYYSIFTALREKNLMPGVTRGLELIRRDEARHIAFGLYMLTRHIQQDTALWATASAQLDKLLPLAQGVFMDVLSEFLPTIPFGLDLNDLIQYARKQYFTRLATLERVKQS